MLIGIWKSQPFSNNVKPVDIIVLVLAISISAALVITAIVPMILGEPVSDTRARFIAATVGSMLTIVSMYVGAKIQRAKQGHKEE